jgi:hypothetical protein
MPERLCNGPAASQMGVLGHSWLFLQPNNSQFSNCQIRNTRISSACVIPTLGIPAKRQAGPSKSDVVTCSTCFIRSRSGSVLPATLVAVFTVFCSEISTNAPPPPVTPGAADQRFLEPDETLTLWQF